MNEFRLKGQLVDLHHESIYTAEIEVKNGRICRIQKLQHDSSLPYILPGFIDAHVHIESSMLIPSEFARMAVCHGSVATISDPHEIANVCGMEGIRFMIENGKKTPFKFFFGAPSCVPATPFETAGATISVSDIQKLMEDPDIYYLAEMMNWPGTLARDPEVMAKIALAQHHNKPVDGHAPGLRGAQAEHYAAAGISTDHECFTYEEARDKAEIGMKIAIREGSAAKNFDALIDLIDTHPDQVMFCSDDKHPDYLAISHIDELVRRAIAKGKALFPVLRAACLNPILQYKLPVGSLRLQDPADFIVVEDLKNFRHLATYIQGEKVAEKGRTLLPSYPETPINKFSIGAKKVEDFHLPAAGTRVRVITALDGQLITPESSGAIIVKDGLAHANVPADLLKIAVINRYAEAPVAMAFVKNFGLKTGAIASTVAHDSHNIIAVGVDDSSLCAAVNLLIQEKGGISAVDGEEKQVLGLPVAGLMTSADGYSVAKAYTQIDAQAKRMGAQLQAPFMTLSFMALLVIPDLKLSDKGLFDGQAFTFKDLFLS